MKNNSKNIHLEKNIQRNIHSKNLTNIHSKRFYTFFWKINHHPGLPQHQNAMSEILNLMMIFIKKKSAQKIHQNNLWKRWKWLILSQLSKHKPRFANWGINDMTMTSANICCFFTPTDWFLSSEENTGREHGWSYFGSKP